MEHFFDRLSQTENDRCKLLTRPSLGLAVGESVVGVFSLGLCPSSSASVESSFPFASVIIKELSKNATADWDYARNWSLGLLAHILRDSLVSRTGVDKIPTSIRETVALEALAFIFLFLSCKLRSQNFSGSYFCSTSRSWGESDWFCFKLLFENKARLACVAGGCVLLDVLGHYRETNFGLKPFYTENFVEIGKKWT